MLLISVTAWADNVGYVIAEPAGGTIEITQYDADGNSMSSKLKVAKMRLVFYYGERPTDLTEGTEVWSSKTSSIGRCIFDVPSLNLNNGYPDWYVKTFTANAARREQAVTEVVFDESFWSAKPTRTIRWFYYMTNLTTVDATNLNTASLQYTKEMFKDCTSLKTIICHDDWNTSIISNSTDMFKDCTSLKGAISYDSKKTNIQYANPTTGYFTSPADISLTWNATGNYFEINDEQDLIDLAEYVRGGSDHNCAGVTFKMTADLDFTAMPDNYHDYLNNGSGNFLPIGLDGAAFAGHFDGQGHTITGLRFINSIRNIGLFISLGSINATVEGVTLVNPVFSASNDVGGIVGTLYAGTVSNCAVVGGTITASNEKAGGIVGFSYYDADYDYTKTISGCTVVGTTVSGTQYVGIIVGCNT